MISAMTEKLIFNMFSAAAIAAVILGIMGANNRAERCEAVGGQIYKGSLCVRDGLIVEDY
jgi:hypothetical protein